MVGLIGKMRAHPGKRDDLLQILLDATGAMPGCLAASSRTSRRSGRHLITEGWTGQADHKASPSLAVVQSAISKGRPLIADFDSGTPTEPVDGVRLAANTA